MIIATYNFLSGGSTRRATHWSAIREHIAPHLMLTQESKPDQHAKGHWREALSGRWGSGVFGEDRISPIDVGGFDGWVVGGELKASALRLKRSLRVFSVHCPAGDHGYVRTMHEILDALAPIAKRADLLLGGDFNVATGYRAKDEPVKFTKGEKDLLDRITREFKLIACWQTANPNLPLAQTLRWTGNREAPYHCDGIFIPRTWRERLKSCTVLSGPQWDALSDHNPVVAVIA